MSLFRKESLKAFDNRCMGKPLVVFPLTATMLAYLSLSIVIISFLILFLGTYTKRIQVYGMISPLGDVTRIYNITDGIIDRVHVHEGDYVKKGDILFSITNDKGDGKAYNKKEYINRIRNKINLTQNSLIDIDTLHQVKRSSLQARLASLEEELSITSTALKLAKSKLEISKSSLLKHERLRISNNISSSQLESAQLEYYESEIGKNDILSRINRLLRDINDIKSSLIELPASMKQEKFLIEKDLAELDMRLIDATLDRGSQILSPVDGVVSSINAQKGKSINRNFLLSVLTPRNAVMEGILYVPNRAIGFVNGGEDVKIRLDAFPYQKFGYISAKIKHVSDVALLPQEIPEITNNKELLYGVKVKLEQDYIVVQGKKIPLKPSMTFYANIMLDNRFFYEWILDPVYSITGKL